MTREYGAEKSKYISRIIKHSRIVGDLMLLLEENRSKLSFDVPEWELAQRATRHDTDKLETNFASVIVSICVDELDSEKDKEEIKNRESKCHDHYATNSHHGKYHKITGEPYTNVDVCEIVCDHIASAKKKRSIDLNRSKSINDVKEVTLSHLSDYPGLELHVDKIVELYNLLQRLIDFDGL